MRKEPHELTREEIKEVLKRQRAGYERMEIERLRQPFRESTEEEKLAFERLMADVNRTRGPSRPCGMVEWYRRLLRRENSCNRQQ